MPIGPGCFDQDASSSTVPGLGDAATVDLVARGTLRGHEPQVAHKLAWILKAGEITNLGEHSDGSNEIDAAHRLQGRDNLAFGHRLADRLFQTLDAFVFLTHPVQKFFEYHALLTMLELLCHEPLHGLAPTSSSPDKCVPAAASTTRSAGACPADPSSLPDGRARDRAWPHDGCPAPTQP